MKFLRKIFLSVFLLFAIYQISLLQIFTQINYKNFLKSQFFEDNVNYLETLHRCRVSRIGCFKVNMEPKLLSNRLQVNSSTFDDCVHQCFQSNLLYFSFTRSNSCYCGDKIDPLTIKTKSWINFDISLCSKELHVYIRRIATCEKVNQSRILSKAEYQCILPEAYQSKEYFKYHKPVTSEIQCLFGCERNGYLLSTSHSVQRLCYCSNPKMQNLQAKHEVEHCQEKDNFTLLRTNVESSHCPEKKFTLGNTTRRIGLASYPHSGSDWLRHLLEIATGFYTGSVYENKHFYKSGHLGEILPWNTGFTLLSNTHEAETEDGLKFSEVILLVRNPYHTLTAKFNEKASQDQFDTLAWNEFLMREIRKWTRSIYTYLGAHIPMHIVYYEDLVENPALEIRNIVKFLDLKIDRFEQRLLCALTDLDSESFKPNNALNRYTKDYREMIDRHIGNARKVLDDQRRDYAVLPSYEKLLKDEFEQ